MLDTTRNCDQKLFRLQRRAIAKGVNITTDPDYVLLCQYITKLEDGQMTMARFQARFPKVHDRLAAKL